MKFNIRKFRKNTLTLVNWVMVGIFITALLSLDADSWIPTILGFVSGLWLAVVSFRSEQNRVERGEC